MRAIFTQTGPGLSIEQGGLGPVVQLGFGATGEAASIGLAPLFEEPVTTDTVLLERAGALVKVPSSAFIAFSSPAIAGETSRATSAEGSLSASLIAATSALGTQVLAIGTAISTEASRATSAEGTLSAGIAGAVSTIGSHTTLIAAANLAISNETTRATAQESVLSNGLAGAVSTIGSHAALIAAANLAISNETTRALAAELALQNAIASAAPSGPGVLTVLTGVSTTLPSIPGQVWNNNGVLSIS